MASIKQAVHRARNGVNLEDYFETVAELQENAGESADYPDAVMAFLEKRKPKFG